MSVLNSSRWETQRMVRENFWIYNFIITIHRLWWWLCAWEPFEKKKTRNFKKAFIIALKWIQGGKKKLSSGYFVVILARVENFHHTFFMLSCVFDGVEKRISIFFFFFLLCGSWIVLKWILRHSENLNLCKVWKFVWRSWEFSVNAFWLGNEMRKATKLAATKMRTNMFIGWPLKK